MKVDTIINILEDMGMSNCNKQVNYLTGTFYIHKENFDDPELCFGVPFYTIINNNTILSIKDKNGIMYFSTEVKYIENEKYLKGILFGKITTSDVYNFLVGIMRAI